MSFFIADYIEDLDKYKEFNHNLVENFTIEKSEKYIITDNILITGNFINKGHLIFQNSSFIIDGGYIDNQGVISFIPYVENKEDLEKIIEIILDKDIVNDFEFTGFFIQDSIKNEFQITVEGPESSSFVWRKSFNIKSGEKIQSPFYFSDDNGLTAISDIKKGDGLYCNPSFLKTNLFKGWKIIIRY